MVSLQQCISKHVSIRQRALQEITTQFTPRSLAKKEYLLHSGQRCTELAFIQSGYLRMYGLAEGEEVTLWIGGGGSFITSLSSFIFESTNYWNIQAVTDCQTQIIDRETHFELLDTYPDWLKFDNLLLARAYTILEQNMFEQLHTTAQQRLNALLQRQPEIFNHVPLQYIASMLGITPETLSRLRSAQT